MNATQVKGWTCFQIINSYIYTHLFFYYLFFWGANSENTRQVWSVAKWKRIRTGILEWEWMKGLRSKHTKEGLRALRVTQHFQSCQTSLIWCVHSLKSRRALKTSLWCSLSRRGLWLVLLFLLISFLVCMKTTLYITAPNSETTMLLITDGVSSL